MNSRPPGPPADLTTLRDQAALFGKVVSHPATYRVLDRVGISQLDAPRISPMSKATDSGWSWMSMRPEHDGKGLALGLNRR